MAAATGHPAVEVLEDAAQGRVKTVYDDIQRTFRVPFVSPVFRMLANYPEYLQLAWRQIQPNIKTVYVERQADEIRHAAVAGMAGLGQPPSAEAPTTATLRLFHHHYPLLLIAVAALRASTNGQYPKLGDLVAEDKRQVTASSRDDVPSVIMVDPDSVSDPLAALFARIRAAQGTDVIGGVYRALAQWPEYLESAWTALDPLTQRPEYRQLTRDLRLMAEAAIIVLPYRVDFNPHTMRLSGLSEQDIDDVRAILDRFYRLLPSLVANVAFLSIGALGQEAARQRPYRAETT